MTSLRTVRWWTGTRSCPRPDDKNTGVHPIIARLTNGLRLVEELVKFKAKTTGVTRPWGQVAEFSTIRDDPRTTKNRGIILQTKKGRA